MKKKIMIRKTIYTLLLAFSLTLGSCDDFLERSAQNLVIPTTCADYTEILQGEGYFYSLINDGTWLNLMTDDMELFTPNQDNTLPFNIIKYRYVYQWRDEIEDEDESFEDELFNYLYSQILVANTCIEALDKRPRRYSRRAGYPARAGIIPSGICLSYVGKHLCCTLRYGYTRNFVCALKDRSHTVASTL